MRRAVNAVKPAALGLESVAENGYRPILDGMCCSPPPPALPLHNTKRTRSELLSPAVGDSEIVMIGEASHGTHEFYHHRAELTKRLITEKGFNCIAVEADWPDAYRYIESEQYSPQTDAELPLACSVNRFAQSGRTSRDESAQESLGDFRRFP